MTTDPAELSLILARRQKRLKYWQESFEQETLTSEQATKLKELFNTYSLLISKMVKATDSSEREDCEFRLESIDRELTSLFEERRHLTSDIGVGAVTDYSSRGGG